MAFAPPSREGRDRASRYTPPQLDRAARPRGAGPRALVGDSFDVMPTSQLLVLKRSIDDRLEERMSNRSLNDWENTQEYQGGTWVSAIGYAQKTSYMPLIPQFLVGFHLPFLSAIKYSERECLLRNVREWRGRSPLFSPASALAGCLDHSV